MVFGVVATSFAGDEDCVRCSEFDTNWIPGDVVGVPEVAVPVEDVFTAWYTNVYDGLSE